MNRDLWEDCFGGDVDDDYEDDHECWEYEDVDTIEGRARCRICRRARSLTSEQLHRELEIEAQWAALYYEDVGSNEPESRK